MLIESNNIHLVNSQSSNFLGIGLTINKFDLNTNNILSKTFSDIKTASVCTNCQNTNIVKDNFGNLLVFGEDEYSQKLIWTKLDNNYNVIWHKTLQPTSNFNFSDIKFSQVINTSDGGYVATGTLTTPFINVPKNIWILKLDSNGDISWFKSYNVSGLVPGSSISIILNGFHINEMSNGDLLAIGRTPVVGSGMYIMRTNSSGVVQWLSHYNLTGFDFPLDSYTLPNGNVLVIVNNYLLEIIPSPTATYFGGEVVSVKKITGPGNSYLFFNGIEPLSDGNFIIHGGYFYDQNRSNFEKGVILKLDPTYNILWSKEYDNTWYVSNVKELNNNLYVSGFEISNNLNTVIGKFDYNGKIDNCYIERTFNVININECVFEDGVTAQLINSGFQGIFTSQENSVYEQQIKCCYIPTPTITATNGSNSCYTTGTYNISSSYAGAVINWSVTPSIPGIIISGQGTTSVQLDLSLLNNQGATLTVHVSYPGACSVSGSYDIKECCIPSGLPPSTVYWNNTTASAINPADNPIVINGVFTVNQNLTLNNKQIYLGPDAKIEVLPNYVLVLNNNTILQAGCNFMWDGIYTEDPRAIIIVQNKCTIKDAKNAIVSKNGGQFSVSSSTLDKNYKHIVVENYNAQHTASVISTQLLCTGGNSLIAPHIGMRTFKAIEIKDVYQLQIGSQLFAADKNTIDNADYGIWAERSKVIVYNNDFKNITTVPPPPGTIPPKREPCPKGTAICSYTDANYYFAELHIGGLAQNEANLFINCGKGIVSNFSHHINIIKNNFNNINQTAVEVNDAEWRNIKIDRNNFTSATTGINIWNCVFSPVDVVNNNFDLGNKTNGTAIILRAIYPSGPMQMHSVRNNCIYNYSNGIVTYNTLGTTIADNIIRIRHTNQPSVKNGINSSFSVNSKILSNDIRLAGNNNTFTTDPNVTGLYASLSMGSNIICNQIRNTGTALRCAGQMPSDIAGNSLLGRYTGLWLSNDGFIGVQDHPQIPGWPSYNTWHTNVNQYSLGFKTLTSQNTNGFNSPIIYRQQGAMYNPNPGTSDGFSHTLITIPTNLGTAQYACAILAGGCNQASPQNSIPNNTGKKPKRISEDIINETPVFIGNSAEAHLLNKKALYHYLKNDNSTLNATEQQFISNNDVLAEGKIREWLLLTTDSNFTVNITLQQQAQSIEASIAPQHTMEQYVKTVMEIYRQRLSAGVDTFSQSQIQQLEEIAHLCPFTDGYGVYMARAILLNNGTELIYNACEFDVVSNNRVDNSNNENIEQITLEEEIADISIFTVYPNPANDYIQVEYETDDNLLFEISNAYGKFVKREQLSKEKTIHSVDVSNLPPGIYFYAIDKNGVRVLTEKLVIVR